MKISEKLYGKFYWKQKIMSKMSSQTKSFIILLGVVIIGTYLAAEVSQNLNWSGNQNPSGYRTIVYPQQKTELTQMAKASTPVDTSTWPRYANQQFGFSFKYKPGWKLLPQTKQGDFTVITIDPGKKFYNIKIYVSQLGLYVMDGLPANQEQINGLPAKDVNGVLYGIEKPPYYVTLDVGNSLSLKPDFQALVNSFTFSD